MASGWHTAALVMRHLVEPCLSAEASLGSPASMRSAGLIRSGRGHVSCSGHGGGGAQLAEPTDRGIVKATVEAASAGHHQQHPARQRHVSERSTAAAVL